MPSIHYQSDDPDARIVCHAPGFYTVQCKPEAFVGPGGQTHVPERNCHVCFNAGGVTVEDLEAIIADYREQTVDGGTAGAPAKKRGRPAKVQTIQPEPAVTDE